MPRKKVTKKKSIYDRLRDQYKEIRTFGGSQFWQPDTGKSTIRLVPFEHNGDTEVFVQQKNHFVNQKRVGCLGPECPLCELRSGMSQEEWRQIAPRTKYLCNVIVRKMEKGKDKLVIARLPGTVFEKMIQYMSETDLEQTDPLDLKKGRDWYITRTGKTWNTIKYDVMPATTATPVGMEVKPIDLVDMQPPDPDVEEVQNIADNLSG